ncbi:MAG: hypothetical protein AB8B73_14110 [Ekhidna sp.]
MLRHLFSFLICFPLFALSQEDLPFQVLVANGATIYGSEVKPLQFVDDVTKIEVKDGGFLSLIHKKGTTYEQTEDIFTFYLKPEKLKNLDDRPNLNVLYSDTTILDQSQLITILHPPFDRSGFLVWNENEPFEFLWHLNDKPVVAYVLTLSDGDGNKIQDFRTKYNQYILKPATFGLEKPTFMVQLSSTFAGETISSKRYQVQLVDAPVYPKKATDLVMKALDLELSPVLALETWKEALKMPNGKNYVNLFDLFLKRNSETLIASGEDIEQLLSQNK